MAALVVAGAAFRLWVVTSPLGPVDGDEAVVGLMARRMLAGSFETFFWGQEYGGSQEAALVALLLATGIPDRWAMELVPIGLHGAAALLVWRIGLRTIDRSGAAALAAGLSWAASPALVWWSTKARGFYGFTLVCGLALLLFCVCLSRQSRDRSRRHAVGLGLALGLGWWASPQILHFAVPGLVWLWWVLRRRTSDLVGRMAFAAPAALVGALPWWWTNLRTGFASLEPAVERATFGEPLPIFFAYGLPMVLGLRMPVTLAWELPAGEVLYAVVAAGLAVIVIAGPRRLGAVRLSVAAYPAVFALLPTTYYYGEPRYLDFLWPLLALLAGAALARASPPVRLASLAAALALTAHGVAGMAELQGPPGEPLEDLSPEPVAALVVALDHLQVDRAFADYWVAYRLTWATEGRIVATPIAEPRDERTDRVVRSAERAAYVVVRAKCGEALASALQRHGTTYDVTPVAGVWDVVVPAQDVVPEDLRPSC